MKHIGMHELKVGDIFTFELVAKNREAFEVLKHPTEKTLICQSRNQNWPNPQRKIIKGKVYLLRNILT